MSAPLPPGRVRPWYACDANPCTCPKAEPLPDSATTAEQTIVDLLALVGTYEVKPPAHRYIPAYVVREFIEGVRR